MKSFENPKDLFRLFEKTLDIINIGKNNMKYFNLIVIFLLHSCASGEYYATQDECKGKGLAQYPQKIYQYETTYYRTVEVPTGNTNCTSKYNPYGSTYGQMDTECKQETRTESQPYRGLATADSNEEIRDSWVKTCIINTCRERYGNADCERKEILKQEIKNNNNYKQNDYKENDNKENKYKDQNIQFHDQGRVTLVNKEYLILQVSSEINRLSSESIFN